MKKRCKNHIDIVSSYEHIKKRETNNAVSYKEFVKKKKQKK